MKRMNSVSLWKLLFSEIVFLCQQAWQLNPIEGVSGFYCSARHHFKCQWFSCECEKNPAHSLKFPPDATSANCHTAGRYNCNCYGKLSTSYVGKHCCTAAESTSALENFESYHLIIHMPEVYLKCEWGWDFNQSEGELVHAWFVERNTFRIQIQKN